jgi:hypothetical protein
MLCYCYRTAEKNVTNFLDRRDSEVAGTPKPLWRRCTRKGEESDFSNGRSRSFAEPVLSWKKILRRVRADPSLRSG